MRGRPIECIVIASPQSRLLSLGTGQACHAKPGAFAARTFEFICERVPHFSEQGLHFRQQNRIAVRKSCDVIPTAVVHGYQISSPFPSFHFALVFDKKAIGKITRGHLVISVWIFGQLQHMTIATARLHFFILGSRFSRRIRPKR